MLLCCQLHAAQLFRGVGGDMMRQAVCSLIEKLALAKCPFHQDKIIGKADPIVSYIYLIKCYEINANKCCNVLFLDTWQELVDDCLKHVDSGVQAGAVKTIPAFFSEYYTDSNGKTIVRNGVNIQGMNLHFAQLFLQIDSSLI